MGAIALGKERAGGKLFTTNNDEIVIFVLLKIVVTLIEQQHLNETCF